MSGFTWQAPQCSSAPDGDGRTPRLAQLGDRVKDPVSGFVGIVVVEARWLHGCIRMGVAPEVLQDGKPQTEHHFDQAQLVVIDEAVYPVTSAEPAPPGAGGPPRETGNFRRSVTVRGTGSS